MIEREQLLSKIKEIKKALGWTNKDIANAIRATEQTVKNALAPSSKDNLPKWVYAMVAVWNVKQANKVKQEARLDKIVEYIEPPKEVIYWMKERRSENRKNFEDLVLGSVEDWEKNSLFPPVPELPKTKYAENLIQIKEYLFPLPEGVGEYAFLLDLRSRLNENRQFIGWQKIGDQQAIIVKGTPELAVEVDKRIHEMVTEYEANERKSL